MPGLSWSNVRETTCIAPGRRATIVGSPRVPSEIARYQAKGIRRTPEGEKP